MAKKRVKLQINYTCADGSVIEYVPKYASEIEHELARVYHAVLDANRVIASMSRLKHWVIRTVDFHMANALRGPLTQFTGQAAADEIARLSFIMEDAVGILSTLTNSRTANLDRLRFILTYGQTPKKREQTYNKADNDREETEEDEERWED